MSPDWHDKPTEPGEWLLVNRRLFRRHTADISSISSWRIDAGDRYYGPIPPDNASGLGVSKWRTIGYEEWLAAPLFVVWIEFVNVASEVGE